MTSEVAIIASRPAAAFLDGARYWEFLKTGATMWGMDQELVAIQAERRYPLEQSAATNDVEVAIDPDEAADREDLVIAKRYDARGASSNRDFLPESRQH